MSEEQRQWVDPDTGDVYTLEIVETYMASGVGDPKDDPYSLEISCNGKWVISAGVPEGVSHVDQISDEEIRKIVNRGKGGR